MKETDFSISEDFSESVRNKRKQLWEYAKVHRTESDKVTLKYDTLYLNKQKYMYDESLQRVVPLA